MARSTSTPAPVVDDAELLLTASRLRFAALRLARLLRQQDQGELGATAVSVMVTVRRVGAPTLGELATSEQVAAPTITRIVGRLEGLGYLERRSDERDRRVSRVVLTATGAAHLEDSRTRRTAWLVDQLALLDPADVVRVAEALSVLEVLTGTSDDPVPVGAAAALRARAAR